MTDFHSDKEFDEKSQIEYTCKFCGWHGNFRDIQIAIDVIATLKNKIKTEVMFCKKCGSEEFE